MAIAKEELGIVLEMKRAISPEVVAELPAGMRKHIVENMYDTRVLCSPAADPDIRDEYEDCIKKSDKINNEILGLVPPNLRQALLPLLNDFEDVNVQIGAYNEKTSYKQGLRDGFQLAGFLSNQGG